MLLSQYPQTYRLHTLGLLSLAIYFYWVWQGSALSIYHFIASVTVLFTLSAYGIRFKNLDSNKNLILFYAIAFKVLGWFCLPLYEDDHFRFLLDGYLSTTGVNPYSVSPEALFDQANNSERLDEVLGQINHPNIATVYGPSLQSLFSLSAWISPLQAWPLRLLLFGFDLLLLMLLAKQVPTKYLILFAWSPLIIKEFAFTIHPDILGALFLLLAFLTAKRGYLASAGIFLALAAGTKIFAIIAIPYVLRLKLKSWLFFIITCLSLTIPWGMIAWFPPGLQQMGNEWIFNAPLYFIAINLGWLTPENLFAFKVLMLSLLAITYTLTWLFWLSKRIDTSQALSISFGLLFLFSPVANPWYFIWLLVFATFRPQAWAWVASLAVLLSYVSGINLPSDSELGLYQIPISVIYLEVALIVSALLFGFYRHAQQKQKP